MKCIVAICVLLVSTNAPARSQEKWMLRKDQASIVITGGGACDKLTFHLTFQAVANEKSEAYLPEASIHSEVLVLKGEEVHEKHEAQGRSIMIHSHEGELCRDGGHTAKAIITLTNVKTGKVDDTKMYQFPE